MAIKTITSSLKKSEVRSIVEDIMTKLSSESDKDSDSMVNKLSRAIVENFVSRYSNMLNIFSDSFKESLINDLTESLVNDVIETLEYSLPYMIQDLDDNFNNLITKNTVKASLYGKEL